MRYKRVQPYETMAEVTFEGGRVIDAECQVGVYGHLNWVRIDGRNIEVTEVNMMKLRIKDIQYMAPLKLEIGPVEVKKQ